VNRPATAGVRDAVFVSCSHENQDWCRKFTQILAPDVRNHWDSSAIRRITADVSRCFVLLDDSGVEPNRVDRGDVVLVLLLAL
jgi:hypothetical protein